MTIMKPYNSHEKKALFYAIQDTDGSPLDLMNIQTYKDGLLAAVTTFIGRHDRDEFGINAKSRGVRSKSLMNTPPMLHTPAQNLYSR